MLLSFVFASSIRGRGVADALKLEGKKRLWSLFIHVMVMHLAVQH